MQQFKGYDEAKQNAQAAGNGGKLPKGAYVCKILGVKATEATDNKSGFIQIQFDIAEGEYKGFFKKQYDENTREDKKYKGKATIYLPKDDGTEQDGWTKNAFARWTNAIEDSNPGYTWDWDETKWKGKLVGILFGTTGTVIEGKEITYTEARTGTSIEKVRSGDYKIPKFKKRNGYTGNGSSASNSDNNSDNGSDDWMNVTGSVAEELPFN